MSKTMTNMSKDEKRMMLFDMQEHPEKYTDEQVERLLAEYAPLLTDAQTADGAISL